MEENKEDRFASARHKMVVEQLAGRDISDPLVLEAMNRVPRHLFVYPENRHLAYADCPLPIGNGQTISQPYMVALMTQLLELKGDERVLEVGTGSGYQAAVLAHLVKEVYTIERFPDLADLARHELEKLGLNNVHVYEGDGTEGLPEQAPFSAILVTAAAPSAPPALLQQLAEGGRLVIPVGARGGQMLERWRRCGQNYYPEELVAVSFVPLVGRFCWVE